jgi:hypothetical protein
MTVLAQFGAVSVLSGTVREPLILILRKHALSGPPLLVIKLSETAYCPVTSGCLRIAAT